MVKSGSDEGHFLGSVTCVVSGSALDGAGLVLVSCVGDDRGC